MSEIKFKKKWSPQRLTINNHFRISSLSKGNSFSLSYSTEKCIICPKHCIEQPAPGKCCPVCHCGGTDGKIPELGGRGNLFS